MFEPIRKYDENVEFKLYRNTPFEFDATASSGSRVTVVTTTVTRPQGSWFVIEAPLQAIPLLPKWTPPPTKNR
jgi:hypothetical protein